MKTFIFVSVFVVLASFLETAFAEESQVFLKSDNNMCAGAAITKNKIVTNWFCYKTQFYQKNADIYIYSSTQDVSQQTCLIIINEKNIQHQIFDKTFIDEYPTIVVLTLPNDIDIVPAKLPTAAASDFPIGQQVVADSFNSANIQKTTLATVLGLGLNAKITTIIQQTLTSVECPQEIFLIGNKLKSVCFYSDKNFAVDFGGSQHTENHEVIAITHKFSPNKENSKENPIFSTLLSEEPTLNFLKKHVATPALAEV